MDDTPTGTLEIVSDDAWVGDVRVPIRTGQPLPDLRLEPRRLLWERADVVEGDPPGCADAPEEARRAFDVVSSGSAPLQVTGWELGPPEEREHFTVCPAPWEGEANAVPPGERRSWEVVFHPRAAARPVAQVTVEHTHGSGKVELRAAAGPGPRLEVVPDSLSWPDLAAGQCGQQALTLANGGDFATAVTLFRFNPLSLQGTHTLSGETFEARELRGHEPPE